MSRNIKSSEFGGRYGGHESRKSSSGQSRNGAPKNRKPVKGTPKGRRKPGRPPRKSNNIDLKRAGIIAACFFAVLFIGYVYMAFYFSNHFFFNTIINGQNFSRQTVEEAHQELMVQVDDYELEILSDSNERNVIRGRDISLAFLESEEIYQLMEQQNGFAWLGSLFTRNEIEVIFPLYYEQSSLEQKIRELYLVTREQVMPVSAELVFDGTIYIIEPEVPGTAIDMDRFTAEIHRAIQALETEIDILESDILFQPEVTRDSPELVERASRLNTYLTASITFNVGEQVVVDGSLIYTWMDIDDDYNVSLNEDLVYEWVTEFGNTFSTRGSTRHLTTPWGRDVSVTGGTYGWWINHAGTTEVLVDHIRAGDVVTIEPVYFIGGRAAVHGPNDWGNTFIQVDLSGQHMWLIVDGAVVFETAIITGLPGESATPQGVYSILFREQDTVLRGPLDPETDEYEWEADVYYWMPITWCGIGFHDATWQTQGFGGQLYRTLGSRGCINISLSAARELFWLIFDGMPVVVHH